MKKIKELIDKSTTRINILIIITISILLLFSYVLYTKYNSGTINILVPYKGTSIFLDGKKISTTISKNQIIKLNRVYRGKHSVLVYLKGLYPWSKTMDIKKDTEINIYPFLMPSKLSKNLYGIITIPTKDEQAKIKSLFRKQIKNRLISDSGNGNVEIKKEGNSILAAWIGDETKIPEFFCNSKCEKIINVFTAKTGTIKKIGFYPKRENIVIFSLGNNIYAIEINKNGIQNFQPIYTGDKPDFVINNQNSILYIRDGSFMFGINL